MSPPHSLPSEKKNPRSHHFVPRFYLEGFSDPSDKRRIPVIWVYEKGQAFRKSTPKNEGRRRDYYAFDIASEKASFVFETWLASIEYQASQLLIELKANHYHITPRDKLLLAYFVALMFSRVPAHREHIDTMFDRTLKREGRALATDEITFRAAAEEYSRETGQTIDVDRLREDILLDDYTLVPSAGHNLYWVLRSAQLIAPELWSMNWQVLRAVKSQPFIASDNPISTTRLDEKTGIVTVGDGFGKRGVVVYFPLNRDACLAMNRSGFLDPKLSAADVRDINKTIMLVAKRFVYASESSELLNSVFQRVGCTVVYGKNAFLPAKWGG